MAKAAYIGIDSVARKVKKIYVGIDGVARKVKKAYIGVAGVARLFYSSGFPLADLPEGSLIKLNEGGTGVNFYLAKHDYESGMNGAGRELLVRKDCYDTRAWHSSAVNAYASSDIDAWLNGDYKGLLDDDIQSVIGTTKFYYTPGNGTTTVDTLSRDIFLLSVTELGKTSSYANVEGSALPIASILQDAYLNGSEIIQWTRSPNPGSTVFVCNLDPDNSVYRNFCSLSCGSRPAFTLPSDAMVNPEPNADGSYTLLV